MLQLPQFMAVVLYSVLSIVFTILAILVWIICADTPSPAAAARHKEKIEEAQVLRQDQALAGDLPDIVAPRRRHIPEQGLGREL